MRVRTITGLALLVSAGAFAQDETAARKVMVEQMAARVPFERAMKGAPYSAETLVEATQTLGDGNRINRKTTGRVYRDGEGRTRREEDVHLTTSSANGPVSTVRTTISIVDPVGGFSYSLDPERKTAWKTAIAGVNGITGQFFDKLEELRKTQVEVAAQKEKLTDQQKAELDEKMKVGVLTQPPTQAGGGARGGGGGRGGAAGGSAEAGGGGRGGGGARGGDGGVPTSAVASGGGGGGRGRAPGNTTVGPLEHKTIEGVAVEGRKTTTIIPAGEVGNEQPITITSEEWRSPELNLLVLTRHLDPRTGESTYRLINIVRAEPDRSLFMVPPDYTVRETGIRRVVAREQ